MYPLLPADWLHCLPVSTGALRPERHLVGSDEAGLLPRPRGLSGLLKVNPPPRLVRCRSSSGINIQISRRASARQIKAAESRIDRRGTLRLINGIVVLICPGSYQGTDQR